MMFSELMFKFMDEFFLMEGDGDEFDVSKSCQKERWSICDSCEHFDEPGEGCMECGCYLPQKIKDQFGECPLDKWISNDEEWKNVYYYRVREKVIEKYPECQQIIENYERNE